MILAVARLEMPLWYSDERTFTVLFQIVDEAIFYEVLKEPAYDSSRSMEISILLSLVLADR